MMLLIAFFAGAEIAFLAANLVKIELKTRQGSRSAKILSYFKKNMSKLLITILIGNNVTLIIYTTEIKEIFDPFLERLGLDPKNDYLLLTFVESILDTLLLLVLAEYIPKAIFRRLADSIVYPSAYVLDFFYRIFWIPVHVANWLSKAILRLLGEKIDEETEVLDRKALDHYILEVIESSEGTPIPEYVDTEILTNAMTFHETKTREFMIPRTEIVALDIESSTQLCMQKFRETKLSRIIIYKDSLDEVEGFIHVTSFFKKPNSISECIQPVLMVPETMSAKVLMKELADKRISVALVVDEFGGTSGLITVEDLMEEILGEIDDEHDEEKEAVEEDMLLVKNENGSILIGARKDIYDLNEEFDLHLPESEAYTTLGGLIMYQEERIPQIGETVQIGHHTFSIVKSSENKIITVRLESVSSKAVISEQ